MLDKKAECVRASESAVKTQMVEWRERIDRSVWAPQNCTSWYQRGEPNGRPWGIWPGTHIEYFLRTRKVPSSDFEYF